MHARITSFRNKARGPVTNFFESSLGKIAYTIARPKEKKTVVFMHGFPTSKELFLPMYTHIDRSIRIISFDLNDFGESDKAGRIVSLEERAAAFEELRAHIGLKKFYLVAHNVGSSIAIEYISSSNKHVEKLVLISTLYPGCTEPLLARIARTAFGRAMIKLAFNPLFRFAILSGMNHHLRLNTGLFEALASPFRDEEGRAALQRNLLWMPESVFSAHSSVLRSIQCPTLVLHGARDPFISTEFAHKLHSDIAGSEIAIIESGSHFLPMDTPADLAYHINKFLNK